MQVEGAVGLVTGGASGLGEGVVRMLTGRGARAGIVDLPSSKGDELVAELGQDRTAFFPTDVTESDQVEAAVSGMVERFGRLDVLVSCAGISSGQRVVKRDGTAHDLDHFRAHVEINLIGLFDVCRQAALAMSRNEPSDEGERGLIVNIASIAGYEGQVGQSSYGASKAGVIGLTVPLARDLATQGIRVMCICPGTMDTPMLATLSDDMVKALADNNVFPKRLGRPSDVGALVAQFMENTFLNSEVVRLDAGLRMGPR